ncbi:MAG: RNA polymerase sigma factor SigZ [Syntrophobacteraceae bacterium]
MSHITIEALWADYSGDLRRFIRGRVPDEVIAEDVLQDVFVKIISQIGALRNDQCVRGWVYKIARNTIIDYYRSRHPVLEVPQTLPSPVSPDLPIIDGLIPCLESMVRELPEKYRRAVLLTEYEGLSQKEMGQRLGLSFSGAKSRAQRAREKLRKKLTDCCRFEFNGAGQMIGYEPHSTRLPCNRSSHTKADKLPR